MIDELGRTPLYVLLEESGADDVFLIARWLAKVHRDCITIRDYHRRTPLHQVLPPNDDHLPLVCFLLDLYPAALRVKDSYMSKRRLILLVDLTLPQV